MRAFLFGNRSVARWCFAVGAGSSFSLGFFAHYTGLPRRNSQTQSSIRLLDLGRTETAFSSPLGCASRPEPEDIAIAWSTLSQAAERHR